MSYRNAQSVAAQEEAQRSDVQRKFVVPTRQRTGVFQCLIVSADPERRALLAQAAADAGWSTAQCSDASSALVHIGRAFVQLAVVDLEGVPMNGPDQAALKSIVDRLARQSGLLLIVCGHADRIDEEIWVRQLGAWMYLPGVVEGSNVALLCGEARHIAQKLGYVERTPLEAPLRGNRRHR